MNGLGNTKNTHVMAQRCKESNSSIENDDDNVESKIGFRQLDTDNEKPIRRGRFKTIYDSKELLTYIEKVEQIKKILPDGVIYEGGNCKNDEERKLVSVSIKEELFSVTFIKPLHDQCLTYDLRMQFSFINTKK